MFTYDSFIRSKIGLLTQKEVKEDKIDYGVSITDKSSYNPNMLSSISNSGYINSNPLYHFKDGKDNGLNMALITNKQLDITEKEQIYNNLINQTTKEVQKLVDTIEEEEALANDDEIQTTNKQTSEN